MLKLLWIVSLVLAGGLVAVPPAGAAGSPVPEVVVDAGGGPDLLPCSPTDCPPPETYFWDSTLDVSVGQGHVSSDSFGGHRIDCPTICSVTDSRTTSTDVRPASGWHQYRLTPSGGRAGYSPSWTGCDSISGPDCLATNDDESGHAVTLTWVDTTAPVVAFSAPARAGAGTVLTASATDNSGTVASYRWLVDHVAVSTGASTGSLQLGALGLSEGEHAIEFWATDPSGNVATAAHTVVYDRSTSLSLGGLEAFVAAPPSLAFSSDDVGVTFTCRASSDLHDGPVHACTSPWTLSSADLGATGEVPDAAYTLEVVATDDVGNTAGQTRRTVLDRSAFSATDATSTYGHRALLRASGLTTNATGAVTFTEDGHVVCTAEVVEGAAQCLAPAALAAGQHALAAAYPGDDLHAPASDVLQLDVARAATSVRGTASSTRVRHGKRAVLRAGHLPRAATGKVVFKGNGRVLCSATVRAGAASCGTPRSLARGVYRVVVTYSGSPSFAGSRDGFTFRVVR